MSLLMEDDPSAQQGWGILSSTPILIPEADLLGDFGRESEGTPMV